MTMEVMTVPSSEDLLPREILKNLTEKVESIVSRAQELATVETQEGADQAGIIVMDIGPVRKFIKSVCDPVCDLYNEKHKAATGLRNLFDSPMATLEKNLKKMIGDFFMARERERKRQTALLQTQLDKEHKKEVRIVAATVALQHGTQAAEEIRDELADAPPVSLEKMEIEGVNLRIEWHAEIIDSVAFVKGLANGKVPMSMFDAEASSRKIDKQASALEGKIDYPGIRCWESAKIQRK